MTIHREESKVITTINKFFMTISILPIVMTVVIQYTRDDKYPLQLWYFFADTCAYYSIKQSLFMGYLQVFKPMGITYVYLGAQSSLALYLYGLIVYLPVFIAVILKYGLSCRISLPFLFPCCIFFYQYWSIPPDHLRIFNLKNLLAVFFVSCLSFTKNIMVIYPVICSMVAVYLFINDTFQLNRLTYNLVTYLEGSNLYLRAPSRANYPWMNGRRRYQFHL